MFLSITWFTQLLKIRLDLAFKHSHRPANPPPGWAAGFQSAPIGLVHLHHTLQTAYAILFIWTPANNLITIHYMDRHSCSCHFIRQVKAIATMLFVAILLMESLPAQGTILWSHPGAVLVCDNGKGQDILHGAIKPQGSNSSSTLYFRFRVNPIADAASKSISDFQAGFVFVEKGEEHLGIGSALGAWAYCAWNVPNSVPKGFVDFNSATPVPPFHWDYIRAGVPVYVAFKIQYVPGHDAHITVWLNPDLSLDSSEINQPTNIVTQFDANATFDEIHLVFRGGNGTGWMFSQMVAGTTFEDLLLPHFWQQKWFFATCIGGLLAIVAGVVRLIERRRARLQLRLIERERAVEAERARIAHDIHDELGAELAQIGLLADVGCVGKIGPPDLARKFTSIAQHARNVVTTLEEIVWAVNPRNDNLMRLADYLCQMADECLTDSPIRLRKDVPTQLPQISIQAKVRHDVALIIKEAFANMLKHSQASEAWLRLAWTKPNLVIGVEDNGCGFDLATADRGNGLDNQQMRIKRIGGVLELESKPGGGTRFALRVQLLEDGD